MNKINLKISLNTLEAIFKYKMADKALDGLMNRRYHKNGIPEEEELLEMARESKYDAAGELSELILEDLYEEDYENEDS